MKAFRVAILFLSALTACYAPRTEPQPKKTAQIAARINLGVDPTTLDPRKVRDLNSVTVAHMLFEGLVYINSLEKPELALAKDVHISPDLKTYTFHLRESFWSNGDPVTAEDFVYAWKKVVSPNFPSDNAFQLYPIQGAAAAKKGEASVEGLAVRALDSYTLQVELESPTPYFLELLAHPVFFPINKKYDEEEGTPLLTNGPFSLVSWQHNHQLSLRKNPLYWNAEIIQLEEVHFAIVSEDTALKMFEKGELDWVGSPLSALPGDALPHLKTAGELRDKSFLGTFFISCNTEGNLLSSTKVRRAFGLAVDRQALVTHVLQGGQTPATGLVPVLMGLKETPYFKDADIQEAGRLFSEGLQEMGIERKNLKELNLVYKNKARGHLIAQVLQQQWEKALGVKIKIEGVEPKVAIEKVKAKQFDFSLNDWIADFNDPINFLEVFKYKKGSANSTSWEDPQYIRLLEDSQKEGDPEKRKELLSRSEAILVDAMPIIPVFEHKMLYLNKTRLKNVVLTSMGMLDLRWAQLEEGDTK